ncbi:MAG: MFS transporter [Candidatus Eisenbacteria bacterium]|nr:MFS transporter [Candidatus Eisenbacteria bacterium]
MGSDDPGIDGPGDRPGRVRPESTTRRTIRISIVEGIYSQVHASVAWPGSVFLTKLAVLLNATPFQFGLLSAIGQFSQVFQPLGAVLTRSVTSRRRVVLSLAGIGRGLVVCYGLLPLLLAPQSALNGVLGVFFLSTALQAIAGNAWIAWISDMIPPELRARFFARRTQVLLAAGLGTGLLLGAIADAFEHGAQRCAAFLPSTGLLPRDRLPGFFLVLFTFAAGVGLVALRILATQPERPKNREEMGAVEMIVEPLRDANFRRLLVYGCWWMFAVGIGAPFWQPFMITTLRMSLVDIQIYGLVSTLASLAVLRAWGRLIDRVGNKAMMRVAILLGGINPLVWVFVTPERHQVLYLEAVTSGIMWAGAGLIAMNFVLAIAPEGKRQIYSGVFGAVTGLAIMTTMLLSGFLLPSGLQVLGLHLEPVQTLFAATGLLRWTALIPLSWIAEPAVRGRRGAIRSPWQFAKVPVEWIAGLLSQRNGSDDQETVR